MKVVFISDNGHSHRKFKINIWLHLLLPIVILVAGYSIAQKTGLLSFSSGTSSIEKDSRVFDNFSQVINKLSVLDAEVQRLNGLNKHLASKSNIDISDFELSKVPAQGGVIESSYFGSRIVRKDNIEKSINNVERSLIQQKLKLKNLLVSLEIKEAEEDLAKLSLKRRNVIETTIKVLKNQNDKVSYDFSSPMLKGYISSPFGKRRDPINGGLRHHGGLDIAAKKGTNVYAIANGFVSFSGKRGAYGNLLEINHSEILTSRYAHLDSYLVKKGGLVKKGDLIGKVGSTGRVTGPHLHLEIRKNNKIMDPKIYLSDALENL